MPNWCEGTLKVRGSYDNLKRFILYGLEPVGFTGEKKSPLEFEENIQCDYFEASASVTLYIKNTRRGFIENLYAYLEKNDDKQIICLNAKFAWIIRAEQLLEICKEYGIDIKIYAFECGMEFNQDIEIVNGLIVHNNKITFNDDYKWECICPNIGG